jgi:L-2-hydroxyglutarate oxidase LhgO
MAFYDVIVVGAGVVGSAMGFALGMQRRNVLVVEKSLSEPGMNAV